MFRLTLPYPAVMPNSYWSQEIHIKKIRLLLREMEWAIVGFGDISISSFCRESFGTYAIASTPYRREYHHHRHNAELRYNSQLKISRASHISALLIRAWP